jgi:hypothetical protein
MLAEDYVAPAVLGNFQTYSRVAGYALNGGGSSYVTWYTDDPLNFGLIYNVGGTFGAFLHRQYGLAIDRELISDCPDNGDPVSSYQCVDQLILRHGGYGFEDDFARIGASLFGMMPMSGTPNGFGFPNQVFEGYSLDSPYSSGYTGMVPTIAPKPLLNGFLATLHTYQIDSIGSSQNTYTRTGVRVPAGTTLVLVILTPEPIPQY